ncbi:putative cytoplasm protein [Rhodotorula diobovata]|uniref:Putative cytoplasm protein n=1 Tax=Rhodotorula diobovata TaxID=5288 RepID=A0A5C5FZE9_9BASI|nr:putative cytoplasm protein [Rhodotorula diobovata]
MTSPRRSVAIVGGGIIGASTAFFLARLARSRNLAIDITLVEGTAVAAGASGKAGGLLALDWHGPATASLAALSYKLHADLATEFDGASRYGYRQLDTLSVSADFSAQSGKARRQKRLAGADLFPWLNADIVTDSDVLGSKDTTAQVHPEQFTHFLVSSAKDLGVRLVYGTATGLTRSPDGSSYTLALDPLGEAERASTPAAPSPSAPESNTPVAVPASSACPRTLTASHLVLAAGPWTGSLLATLGLAAQAGRAADIGGSRAHSVVLRTAEGRDLPAQALFTSIKEKSGHAEPEIYNRPDGTSYACGPTDSTPLPLTASHVAVSPEAISSLLAQTARLAPRFLSDEAGVRVERRQACYLPVGSGDPVVGRIEGAEGGGVWVAAGHSCWGICNGPGTGQVMAELLLDGKASSADIRRLGP